jgi:hypothetical protein
METCRELTDGIPVDDREAVVGCPSLLFSLLRGRDSALHVLPGSEPRCHRRERRYANQSRALRPRVPSPEGEGQEEGMGGPVRWFGVLPTTARRCAPRRSERSRWFFLPLFLPPLRKRLGPASSVTARAEMPSTGEAIRQPEQSPPPPSPFSRGRRTGRGDGEAPAKAKRPERRCGDRWGSRPTGANPDPDQAEAEGKHGIGWGRPGG